MHPKSAYMIVVFGPITFPMYTTSIKAHVKLLKYKHWQHNLIGALRPPLKKSLFPVQRVAEIVASRAAAFFFGKKIITFLNKKNCKNEIKKFPVCTSGRSTHNNFFLRVA